VFITSAELSPSEEVYRRYVTEQHLKNAYRLAPKLYDNICKVLMFNGVPHYVRIDKSGKISSADFSVYRIMTGPVVESVLKMNKID